ncbi:hypothetical protein K440DRAFT_642082 [Wilcoxina mikolae CBS 423.85]|nr:hypothetical protein K440DRAFT_642082 [Wilcoxina mikolae CBS 423.85]
MCIGCGVRIESIRQCCSWGADKKENNGGFLSPRITRSRDRPVAYFQIAQEACNMFKRENEEIIKDESFGKLIDNPHAVLCVRQHRKSEKTRPEENDDCGVVKGKVFGSPGIRMITQQIAQWNNALSRRNNLLVAVVSVTNVVAVIYFIASLDVVEIVRIECGSHIAWQNEWRYLDHTT